MKSPIEQVNPKFWYIYPTGIVRGIDNSRRPYHSCVPNSWVNKTKMIMYWPANDEDKSNKPGPNWLSFPLESLPLENVTELTGLKYVEAMRSI